ncbi:Uncharacterized protein Adt_06424 [Abeliophyllum distichum]|uniref:Uncharacterized protein n=1 Tax=Abeliophyllum distichum TaxID=126358 RepID=A0ABD1V942_9LAMI
MKKSLASILQFSPDSTYHQYVAKEPYLHRGKPVFVILFDDEASLAETFKFTFVGKFSHCKPKMVDIHNSFQKFEFCGCPMRILKWTCDFHPDVETSIAPTSKPFITPTPKPAVVPTSKSVVVPANKSVDAPVPIVDRTEKGKEKEVVVEDHRWVPVAGFSLVVAIPPPIVHVGPTV